jgi:hypothetical protein
MDVVIYTKKGKRNYKETRLIEKIKPLLEKELDSNPSLYGKFVPAKNYAELEKMYSNLSSQETEFEEIKENNKDVENENDMAKTNKEKAKDLEEENLTDSKGLGFDDDDDSDYNDFVDPFNREEPIVREYVTDGASLEPESEFKSTGQTEFEEPSSFDEAFELPEEMDGGPQQSGGSTQRREKPQKEEREPREPINPDFDDMSSAKKKKSTKKFAKYIVETVCMLSEKGFVWYANKDINESKLNEYELKGEMDLSLLVTLEDGQEVTVKQFFQIQCLKAEELAVIDKEEKEDLADSLAEVLMEKGVGPTPTQELMLVALKVLGGQAITLISLKSQTNALLGQLRAMKKEGVEGARREEIEEPYREQYSAPSAPEQYEPQSETRTFDDLDEVEQEEKDDEVISLLERQDPLLLEKQIETKE